MMRKSFLIDLACDEEFSDRLASMPISSSTRKTSVTTLTGRICDQAELIGVLNALYDLHLPVISVRITGGGDQAC